MAIAEFNKEFETTLTEGGKSRTKAIANTPLSELAANRKIGESKSYTPTFIKGATDFLIAAGLGEYTPAQLADNPQLVRLFVESPAYEEQGGKGRASNAQKFLSGIMEAGGFGKSWPSRTLKTEMPESKKGIVADPTRARVKAMPPDIYSKLKVSLSILQKENPEAAAQLGLHMFGGFRPEDLNDVKLENIDFKTGLVSDIEIKGGGSVQKTSGVLAPPLLDMIKQYVGDRTEGVLFENTQNNSQVINKVFDRVFPPDYLTVTSPLKGTRTEPLRVKKLRNLNETLLTTFGVDEKSDLRKVMTFRAPSTVAGKYATQTANRRRINEVVAKNVAAFVAGSETTSTAQYFNDIGVSASNKTSIITPTKELIEDLDFVDDISPEYYTSLPESGNVSTGKSPGQISPAVTEAFNSQAIAQARAAESEAELARRQADLKLSELPEETVASKSAGKATLNKTPASATSNLSDYLDQNPEVKNQLEETGLLNRFLGKAAKTLGVGMVIDLASQFIEKPVATATEIGKEVLLERGLGMGPAAAVSMAMQPTELASGELTDQDRGYPMEAVRDTGFIDIDRGPEAAPATQPDQGFLSR